MTKKQQNALDRLKQAVAVIQETAPLEIRRESQQRKKVMERAYQSLRCHGTTLDIEVPQLSTYYYPKQYLEYASQVLAAAEHQKSNKP